MKPLHHMGNTDKAKLLAMLFPEQLPDIIQEIQQAYSLLIGSEESLRLQWDNTLLPFEAYYRAANNTAAALQRHGSTITVNSTLFAEELFAGANSVFVIECLLRQAGSSTDNKYRQAAALLFK